MRYDDYDRQQYDRRGDYGARRPGQSDRDWSDDFAERDGGRSGARRGGQRVDFRDDYRDDCNYNDDDREYRDYDRNDRRRRGSSDNGGNNAGGNKGKGFTRRHPVLMNFIYVVITACVLCWLMMLFLDFWTFHGQERVVPDVKGQVYTSAAGNVDVAGLRPVLSDSVFDSYARPGTVVEQTPIPGARIKKGGSVYLTIVAFSPKLVTVPDFYNVSVRQARSMFEGLGIKEIREVPVISEFSGLVLGAKFNGVSLQPGARIPVSAIVTLEVGSGYEEEYGAEVDTLAIDETIEELNIE